MVLWEITLATAYFLGLKRTYRLALKIQRRLVTQNHPKIRGFAHRRTRAIFDMALKVHYNIQQRDLDVGRSVGNWILRWLDRAKPSAHIRPPDPPSKVVGSSTTMTKGVTNPTQLKTPPNNSKPGNQEPGRHLFTSYRNAWPKPLAGISMMRIPKPLGTTLFQYRQISASSRHSMGGFEGVFRKDIVQWMQRS